MNIGNHVKTPNIQ